MRKKLIILATIIFIVTIVICITTQVKKFKQKEISIKTVGSSAVETEKEKSKKFIYERKELFKEKQSQIREYETMPETIKEQKVIGKLEIPAINLETCILAETNEKTLNISVTKLAGPEINKIGNFCITGHNYPNTQMFFKLAKVDINDEIILTDTYERRVYYKVYEKKEIKPNEIEVLSQDTKEEKEVTLITCTFGARKRIAVKAVECYD